MESFWFSFLVTAGVLLVGRLFARSRTRADVSAAPGDMRYPTGVFVFSAVFMLLAVGGSLALLIWPDPSAPNGWVIAVIGLAFGAMGAWSVAESLRRYTASADGLQYVSALGTEQTLRWEEVRRVRYSPSMRWFVLSTTGGQTARVSAYMTGLTPFARHLLRSSPESALDPPTRAVLHATAAGRPPSLS